LELTVRDWIIENWKSFDHRAECINTCAEETDKARRTARKVMKSLEDTGIVNWELEAEDTQEKKPQLHFDPNNKIAHLSLVSRVPHSEEDLMNISGLGREEWECVRQRSNFWGNENNPNFQIRAEFARKFPEALEHAVKYISDNFKFKYNKSVTKPLALNSDNMAEFMLPDLHLGRVNTDGTATLEIVKQEFENAIDYFIETVLVRNPVEKVVLVLGNDYYNSSNCHGETFKGTKQTEHPIWEETFNLGTELAISNIIKIQEATGAEVEVVIVLANHDYESSFYLGKILEVCFKDNPMIKIQCDMKTHKFVQFGKVLIGYCHKAPSTVVSLPLLMANKLPLQWAETTWREWHIAHLHQKNSKIEHSDVNGVRIRMFPTITAPSDWEDSQGYGDAREGTLILWHKIKGCIAEFYYRK
jgi:hypothetical protein